MTASKVPAVQSLYAETQALMDECDTVMDELEAKCCVPRRSPRMETLRGAIAETRTLLAVFDGSDDEAERTVETIENAGAQIGSLQVTCCAPARMPLYDTLLHNLMTVQRAVKRHAKLAH